jgi:hypothetical protein
MNRVRELREFEQIPYWLKSLRTVRILAQSHEQPAVLPKMERAESGETPA